MMIELFFILTFFFFSITAYLILKERSHVVEFQIMNNEFKKILRKVKNDE